MTADALPRVLAWLRPEPGFPWVPAAILLAVLIAAIGGDALAPFDPNGLDLGSAFKPPFWLGGGTFEHPLGTDNLGRDILSRIIAGDCVAGCTGSTASNTRCAVIANGRSFSARNGAPMPGMQSIKVSASRPGKTRGVG